MNGVKNSKPHDFDMKQIILLFIDSVAGSYGQVKIVDSLNLLASENYATQPSNAANLDRSLSTGASSSTFIPTPSPTASSISCQLTSHLVKSCQ